MKKIVFFLALLALTACGAYNESEMKEAKRACENKMGEVKFEHDVDLRPIHAKCNYSGYIWKYSRYSGAFYDPQLVKVTD